MDADPAVLATAGPEERANLDRENVPDPLAGEQTWPTEEVGVGVGGAVLLWRAPEVARGRRPTSPEVCCMVSSHPEPPPLQHSLPLPRQPQELVEAEAERRAAAKLKKRRLPAGTSEYQAAWILDEDEGSETGSEAGAGSDEAMEEGAPAGVPLAEDDVDSLLNGGAEGTEADMDVSTGGIGGMDVAFLAFLGYEGPEAGFTGF